MSKYVHLWYSLHSLRLFCFSFFDFQYLQVRCPFISWLIFIFMILWRRLLQTHVWPLQIISRRRRRSILIIGIDVFFMGSLTRQLWIHCIVITCEWALTSEIISFLRNAYIVRTHFVNVILDVIICAKRRGLARMVCGFSWRLLIFGCMCCKTLKCETCASIYLWILFHHAAVQLRALIMIQHLHPYRVIGFGWTFITSPPWHSWDV